MAKLSIYSKTRAQLRSDLTLASVNSKPEKELDVLPESIGTREGGANGTNDCSEEAAV